jgi:hypothetical protein
MCVFWSADQLLVLVAGIALSVPSGSNNFLRVTAIGDEENTILPNVGN